VRRRDAKQNAKLEARAVAERIESRGIPESAF
jgi:hypothetical protein